MTSVVLVVVVRVADVAIAIVAVVVPVVPVVLVVRVVRAAVPVAAVQVAVVRVARATRWVPVVLADQAAIAVLVVRVPIVDRVVLVVPVVRRTDSSTLALPAQLVTQAGKMQHRSSRASAPMASRCRRAPSARVSRSAPTQMAWVPTESRGIPSVAQSARPSVPHPVIPA